MNQGKMVFAQLMEFAPYHVFKYCVKRYDGDYKVQDFTCWKQFLCMAFGQLTHRESFSDTALCLKLIEQAKVLYAVVNQLDIKLKGAIYALDSTNVDLCITTFWWATFRTTKSAIKMHTILDLKTQNIRMSKNKIIIS